MVVIKSRHEREMEVDRVFFLLSHLQGGAHVRGDIRH